MTNDVQSPGSYTSDLSDLFKPDVPIGNVENLGLPRSALFKLSR